ncbi:MAG: PmoA family protein [Candidatus Hydrogenedentes bacterium]|nr:PmoA family protein [Candidatus Hydrogenedentota bacterium]
MRDTHGFRLGSVGMCALFAALGAYGEFTLDNDGMSLRVFENGTPVLVYNYGIVTPPEGIDAKYRRSSYIHPLYDLDGIVMSQDFPDDHYHHRGVFWTWPNCTVGERPMDVWLLDGVRPVFDTWLAREAGATAHIAVQNLWRFDDDGATPIREHIDLVVHPSSETSRAIDFTLRFENISDAPVTFLGSPVDKKGYGGFCFRPDKVYKPFTFTTIQGVCPEDALAFETPWADVSWSPTVDSPVRGVAIFQHPSDPGYPHKGWIFRHYAFLGASWPHNDPFTLHPGDSFQLKYRVLVHRGSAEDAGVAKEFDSYTSSATGK